MSQNMRRDFTTRAELTTYLREQFPAAAAVDDHISPTEGGPAAAEARLTAINPSAYEKTRNYTDGEVTYLSPYIRHGVLPLRKARDFAEKKRTGAKPGKLIQELAWRDYFQRLYRKLGRGIWQDREAYKTGFSAADYADELPEDIRAGNTGLRCVDDWQKELVETGYLHNHARMWLAGYIVHWRQVKWQAGARWFLQHLLDGDPASNNLSWQWVASTFSHKPYFFNRENIERFSGGAHCRECPLVGRCDFEGSYAALENRLFPHKPPTQPTNQPTNHRRKGRKKWHQ